jgi:hypothetical protein
VVTAAVVPVGAVVAVVVAGPSETGLLQLHTAAPAAPGGAPAPVAGAVGAPADPVAAAGATSRPPVAVRVGTRDGRLSFVAPQGWQYGPCPQGGDSCVEISPDRLGGGDAIDVLVSAPAAGDDSGTGSQDELTAGRDAGPGTSKVTVDGRPAVRIDLASNASVLVYGAMPVPGERFLVSCRYSALQQQVRQGCDQVTSTLTLAIGARG